MGTFTIDQTQVGKVLYLSPNADGCNIDLTPVGAANNWECVDDARLSPNDDTDYVLWDLLATGYDLYGLPNHTTEAGVINYVQIFARGKVVDYSISESGVYKIILTEDVCSNIYKSNNFNLLVNNYTSFNNLWVVNPRTTVAWTWADIDNLQIGIECSSPTVIGSEKQLTLRPNGDDAFNCRRFCVGGCDFQYQAVDEVAKDNFTTYVYADSDLGGSPWDRYNLDDHTTETGTITNVTVFAWVNPQISGGDCETLLNTGGTQFFGTQESPPASQWTLLSTEYDVNPDTLVAWTWADIDALQAGIRLWGDAVSKNCCTQVYVVVTFLEDVNSEIRTTQMYALINYDAEVQCVVQIPDEISVDHSRNTKMLNFWSGNRAVYDLSRSKKTMVMTGIFYGTDACEKVECMRTMGEFGSEITIAGLTGAEYNGVFRIKSFGAKKIQENPLTFRWILECEFSV